MINDIDRRIHRYLEFYKKEEPALLLHVRCLNRMADPGKQSYLNTLWHSDFHKKEHRKKFFDDLYDEVMDENRLHPLADDYLPSGKIVWGPIFSVIIKDRPINAQEHSSWLEPCLPDLGEIDRLRFELDENNFWWQLYKEAKENLSRRLEFVTPVYHQGILDLAWDLRGNDLYADFYEDPEQALKLVEFCTDALIRIGDASRAIRPAGARTDYWVPGWGFNALVPGCGGITTCDTSCQLSPEFFQTFEVPYMEKIQNHAPGWLLHTHSVGARHQRTYATLPGLEILQIVADPNIPTPAESMPDIVDRIGLKPVIITTTPGMIYKNIDALRRARAVIRASVADEKEGAELLAFVRRHSRISD
jgi:hypothetical protein